MPDDFDPYYTWLAIPAEEQPPDHYRLLGVRQFEPNLDVINNAADQRMVFIRTFQIGKRSALSQKVLNEIATARACLLDPDRRQIYDRQLNVALARSVTPPPVTLRAPSPQEFGVQTESLPFVASHLPVITQPAASPDPPSPSKIQVYSELAKGWFREAIGRLRQISLPVAAAYGVLALGTVLLASSLIWTALGGNRRPTIAEGAPSQAPLPAQPVEPAESEPASSAKAVDYSPLVHFLAGPYSPQHRVRISPSGKHLAVWKLGDPRLELHDVGSRALPRILEIPDDAITCVCFSSDSQLLVAGGKKSIVSWNVNSSDAYWRALTLGPTREVTVSLGLGMGMVVAVCDAERELCTFLLADPGMTTRNPFMADRVLSLSADGKRLAAIGNDHSIVMYDLEHFRNDGILTAAEGVRYESAWIRGDELTTSFGRSFGIFDMRTGTWKLNWASQRMKDLDVMPEAVDPVGRLFAIQSQGELSIVKFPGDKLEATIYWPQGKFEHLEFSVGTGRLVTSGPEGSLLIWDLAALQSSPGRAMYTAAELAKFPSARPKNPVIASTSSSSDSLPPQKLPATTAPEPAVSITPSEALEHLRDIGIANLPPRPEEVRFVSIYKCRYVDDDARFLAALPRIEGLQFIEAPVTGQTLKHLKNCRGLKNLMFFKTEIRDADLAHLAELTSLRVLDLSQTEVTAKGVAHLKNLKKLERILLPQNTGRELIPLLANFPALKYFTPFPPGLEDGDARVIGQLRLLEHLDLQQATLTVGGYEQLANLTEVSSIFLSDQTPPAALGHLTKMKLVDLSFPNSATERDLAQFRQMKTIRFLRPPRDLSDDGVKVVAEFPGLEYLNIAEARNITEAGLRNLATMTSLKSIDTPPQMGDQGLINLVATPNLMGLHIHHECRIGEPGLNALASLPKLENLWLASIDDHGVALLAKSKSLKRLSLFKSAITAESLSALNPMNQLEMLSLTEIKVTSKEVETLKMFTGLKFLIIQNCAVSPEDAAALKAALPTTAVNIYQ